MSNRNNPDDTDVSPPNPIGEGLLDRRTVVLSGEISPKSVAEAGRQMMALQMRSPDKINLIIDSGGGATYAALHLCDLMRTVITSHIRGIALGDCGSAATFIMLHCDERLTTPFSQFLIHSGTRSKITIPINQTTTENLEQLLKDTRATEEMVIELYRNKLTPTAWKKSKPSKARQIQYVQQLIARGDQRFDNWLTAEEAVEVGLVTKIVRDKLDIFSD